MGKSSSILFSPHSLCPRLGFIWKGICVQSYALPWEDQIALKGGES